MFTYTFVTDAIDPDEDIIIQGAPGCTEVRLWDASDNPTAKLRVRVPALTGVRITYQEGNVAVLTPVHGSGFLVNQTIGSISASAGTITVNQLEK